MDILNNNFKEFRKDLKEALKAVEAKHDINLKIGSISYSPDGTGFTSKFTAVNTTVNGKNVAQIKFDRVCDLYGFKSSDFNREFTVRGQRLKLVGFNSRAPKNCCKIEDVNTGASYSCGESYVTRGFLTSK